MTDRELPWRCWCGLYILCIFVDGGRTRRRRHGTFARWWRDVARLGRGAHAVVGGEAVAVVENVVDAQAGRARVEAYAVFGRAGC